MSPSGASPWTQFPKVELHLHLDPSLGFDVVKALRPETTMQEFRETFIAPDQLTDLVHFLRCIEPAIALLQTRESLRLAVTSLMNRLADDNVMYAEIRFAPLQHTRAGLRPEEVTEAVLDAFASASVRTGIEGGIILCTLRHYTAEQGLETARLAVRFRSQGVVGLDLAGDEANFPILPHVPAFRLAGEQGLGLTAHAGEALGAESVRETIDLLRPQRIGHGVRCFGTPAVVDLVRRRGIHLETCPSSNVQIGVVPNYASHPSDALTQAGVSVGINTDTRTACDVTLNLEYERMQAHFGWAAPNFAAANRAALAAAFIPEVDRHRLLRRFDDRVENFNAV